MYPAAGTDKPASNHEMSSTQMCTATSGTPKMSSTTGLWQYYTPPVTSVSYKPHLCSQCRAKGTDTLSPPRPHDELIVKVMKSTGGGSGAFQTLTLTHHAGLVFKQDKEAPGFHTSLLQEGQEGREAAGERDGGRRGSGPRGMACERDGGQEGWRVKRDGGQEGQRTEMSREGRAAETNMRPCRQCSMACGMMAMAEDPGEDEEEGQVECEGPVLGAG